MIKKYKIFIKEKYTIDQNDQTDMASSKIYFNKSESDIKEFLSKKITIDNIYATYTDEKDLISKLFSQKLIPTNTSNKKQIQFTNPLIGMYSQSAEKKRELKSIEDKLKSQKDSLVEKQSMISQNPDTREALNADIQYIQSKISDLSKQVSKMNSDIVTLERNTEQKLKQMKIDLTNNKKKIDYLSIK